MKKLKPIEALAKIKVLIGFFYEEIGREIVDDIEIAREELIQKIDDVLRKVEIPAKNVVIEKMELDKNEK